MMMRTMAIAIMKIVDIAIIRAVARCPCPERSAGMKKINEGATHRIRLVNSLQSALHTVCIIL